MCRPSKRRGKMVPIPSTAADWQERLKGQHRGMQGLDKRNEGRRRRCRRWVQEVAREAQLASVDGISGTAVGIFTDGGSQAEENQRDSASAFCASSAPSQLHPLFLVLTNKSCFLNCHQAISCTSIFHSSMLHFSTSYIPFNTR